MHLVVVVVVILILILILNNFHIILVVSTCGISGYRCVSVGVCKCVCAGLRGCA